MKKLLSLGLVLLLSLATQMGTATPAYAGTHERTHKIDGHLLYGNYSYANVHIEDGKLIAKGNWRVYGSPEGGTVEFQIVQPITYDSYTFNADGTASLGINSAITWTLPKPVTVMRSATVAGDKSVSFALDTNGLPDGLYQLHETVTKGAHKEGHITEDMFLVIYKGVPSLQVTPYAFPQITGYWTNDGHIGF